MQEVIFTFKSFKAEIPSYLQSLRFRKLSVNTIRSYEYDLKHWTEALTVLLDENGEITNGKDFLLLCAQKDEFITCPISKYKKIIMRMLNALEKK